ncbi:MAG: hypothetical protein JXA66_01375 [Oligoflexia bacterium]|nr:hypothetical protein [Oligoflexia bacterium]
MSILLFAYMVIGSASAQLVSPETCDDLLPDMGEYIDFMDEVASFWSHSNPQKSTEVYELLAIRTIYQKHSYDFENPIDELVRKAVCECYEKNDKKLFKSNSGLIRTFLSENLAEIKKQAQEKYVNLQMEKKLREYAASFARQNRARIRDLKKQAVLNTRNELRQLTEERMSKLPKLQN